MLFALLLAFGCARDGVDGAPGPAGPQGIAGERGADGRDGSDGANGLDAPPGPHWVDRFDLQATNTLDLVHVDVEGLVWGIDSETGATYGVEGDAAVDTYYAGRDCTGVAYVASAPPPDVPFRVCGDYDAWYVRPRDLQMADAAGVDYLSVATPIQCYNAPGFARLVRLDGFDRRPALEPPDLGLVGPLRVVR